MTTVLVQSPNKKHVKHVFQNKFRMIFHDQKTLSLNWVLLNRAPISTQHHTTLSASTQLISTSTQLHPANFSLHPALCSTLNNIWTKILHVIGQFPQI